MFGRFEDRFCDSDELECNSNDDNLMSLSALVQALWPCARSIASTWMRASRSRAPLPSSGKSAASAASSRPSPRAALARVLA